MAATLCDHATATCRHTLNAERPSGDVWPDGEPNAARHVSRPASGLPHRRPAAAAPPSLAGRRQQDRQPMCVMQCRRKPNSRTAHTNSRRRQHSPRGSRGARLHFTTSLRSSTIHLR